ncbi:polysaccharide deacetylase family protein [Salsuginibacillus kocurii]|uniref:polysaccharide deacetylase family protein n=1 Tax=Salsuginibacillus kocurii TaxID=427078 RepID=UPI0003828E12|nr:polysaccharide deacetylase family protein [Salsuginibacillus kocurii]
MKKFWRFGALIGSFCLMIGCTAEEEASHSEEEESPSTNEEESDEEDSANGIDIEESDEEAVTLESEDESEAEEVESEKDEPEYKYEVNDASSIVPIDEATSEVVLMTIDDAPEDYGHKMAETLAEEEIPAIFFINGHFIDDEEGEEQLKQIDELGFEIGNHTMTHRNLNDLSEEEQHEEIVDLNDKIEDITGERPRFFRAPFGENTEYSRSLMEEEEMISMNWTYGYDWEEEYLEEEALAEQMVETEHLSNGANLLMHDREWSYEALPAIVDGIEEKGYEFVDPDLIGSSEE